MWSRWHDPSMPDRPSTPNPALHLDGVALRHANGVDALAPIDVTIQSGRLTAIVGPSGCGKSTLLRVVAGLLAPTAGRVEWLGAEPMRPAFVFQDPTLMPWASVADNTALPLRLSGRPHKEAVDAVMPWIERVGLGGFAFARPHELSGGMRMRASLARALATDPNLLLLDEPFAALDEITRFRLNDELLGWAANGPTILFVTHSVFEAIYLADRVLVMSARPGRIEADVAVEAPVPRTRAWRGHAAYARQCSELSQRLESAAGTP
jgi:NitT/TauT family transport system ATP-binding protein